MFLHLFSNKTYKRQLDMDNNIRRLFVEMSTLYATVNELQREEGGKIRAMAKSQEGLLPRIAKETKECCEFIEEYANHEFGKFFAAHSFKSPRLMTCIPQPIGWHETLYPRTTSE